MSSVILNSLEKPVLEPLGKSPFSIFLGVELEFEFDMTEDPEKHAKQVIDLLGDFIIVKRDGTLKWGFEICSRPASLELHKETWPKFFQLFQESKMMVKPSCGMHVHIGREFLSDLQIGKIITFVHRKENYPFIRMIAERDSNMYNSYTTPRTFTDAKHRNYISLSKSVGVNLQNSNTIELRIFNSTLDLFTFLKNLEFAHALTEFTFPSRISLKDSVKYQNFINFVKQYHDSYSNLIQFLTENNYLSTIVTNPKSQTDFCYKPKIFNWLNRLTRKTR